MRGPGTKIITVDPLRRRRGLPEKEWEKHKAKILALRAQDGKTLPEIRKIMMTDYGFYAGEAEYKHRFKKWQASKNFSPQERDFILCHVSKRPKKLPKFKFKADGSVVPQERIQSVWNHRQRNFLVNLLLQEITSDSPSIRVRLQTPSPSPPPSQVCYSPRIEELDMRMADAMDIDHVIPIQPDYAMLEYTQFDFSRAGATPEMPSMTLRPHEQQNRVEPKSSDTVTLELSQDFIERILSILGISMDYTYNVEEQDEQVLNVESLEQSGQGGGLEGSDILSAKSTIERRGLASPADTRSATEVRSSEAINNSGPETFSSLDAPGSGANLGSDFPTYLRQKWQESEHLPQKNSAELIELGIRIFATELPLPVQNSPFTPVLADIPVDILNSNPAKFYFWMFILDRAYEWFPYYGHSMEGEYNLQRVKIFIEQQNSVVNLSHHLQLQNYLTPDSTYDTVQNLRCYVKMGWEFLRICCSRASALSGRDVAIEDGYAPEPSRFLEDLVVVIEELRGLPNFERLNYFEHDWRILAYYGYHLYYSEHDRDALHYLRVAKSVMPRDFEPVCRYYATLSLVSVVENLTTSLDDLSSQDSKFSTIRCPDGVLAESGLGANRPLTGAREHLTYHICKALLFLGTAHMVNFKRNRRRQVIAGRRPNSLQMALSYFEGATNMGKGLRISDYSWVQISTIEFLRELLAERGLIMYAKPLSHYVLRVSEKMYGPKDSRTIEAIMNAAEDSFKLAGIDIFPVC